MTSHAIGLHWGRHSFLFNPLVKALLVEKHTLILDQHAAMEKQREALAERNQ